MLNADLYRFGNEQALEDRCPVSKFGGVRPSKKLPYRGDVWQVNGEVLEVLGVYQLPGLRYWDLYSHVCLMDNGMIIDRRELYNAECVKKYTGNLSGLFD